MWHIETLQPPLRAGLDCCRDLLCLQYDGNVSCNIHSPSLMPPTLSWLLLTCLLLFNRLKRSGISPWGAMLDSIVFPISSSASLSLKASASTSSVWVSKVQRSEMFLEIVEANPKATDPGMAEGSQTVCFVCRISTGTSWS